MTKQQLSEAIADEIKWAINWPELEGAEVELSDITDGVVEKLVDLGVLEGIDE